LIFRPNFKQEPGMARNKKRTPQVEEVRVYVEGVAKNLADRLWGPKGPHWGTKLTQLEDLVVEIREVLSEKMLDVALERQALVPATDRPAAFQTCSGCGKPAAPDPDDPLEPRLMQTRGGEAEWQEPKHYCRPCRQAFFPSEQESGR
jgi:hypothetical protein